MERTRAVKTDSKLITVLKSLVMAYVVTGVLLVILSFLLYKFKLSEGIVSVGIIVVYILATFLAGFYSGKKIGSRKFVWGLYVGACYFLILLAISVIVNRGFGEEMKDFVSTLLLCVGSGMLGGMLS